MDLSITLHSVITLTTFSLINVTHTQLLRIQNQQLTSQKKRKLLWSICLKPLEEKLLTEEFWSNHNFKITIELIVSILLVSNSEEFWKSWDWFHQQRIFSNSFWENIWTKETSEKSIIEIFALILINQKTCLFNM